MKARLFDRILLGAYLVLIMLACLLGGLLIARFPAVLYNSFIRFSQQPEFGLWAAGLCLLMGLVALYLLLAPNKKPPRAVVLKTEAQNTIRITFQALEQIARRYVADYTQVLASSYKFAVGKNGVTLYVQLSLKPDAVIPQVTQELHDGLITHLLTYSGLRLVAVELTVVPAKNPGKAQANQPAGTRVL